MHNINKAAAWGRLGNRNIGIITRETKQEKDYHYLIDPN